MLIKPDALTHWINHFYGYGSWQASFWFVAHEESGGDLPEEVAEKLDHFHSEYRAAKSPTLCDLRTAYQKVGFWWEGPKADQFESRFDFRFGAQAQLNKVWENLIRFRCGYQGLELPEMLDYQRQQFANSSSEEALLRLFPLPGATHHGWNYNWLDLPSEFSFLKSRTRYEEHLYHRRIGELLKNIENHQPEVVVMYGMSNINALKRYVTDFYPQARFTLVQSIKQKIPQHHRAQINGTKLLVTTQIPALRHRRVETGFDWYAFGEFARSNLEG